MPPELETSYQVDHQRPAAADEDIAAISELINAGGDTSRPEPRQEAETAQPDPDPVETPDAQAQPDQGDEPAQEQDEADADAEQVAIDYDQVIPMPDGMDPMTIGQLKDLARDHREIEQERDTWESTQAEQQRELMATRHQLVELANLMGDIKPEVVQYVQQMQATDQQREAELLLQTFPDWADGEKKAAARSQHLDTVKQYGFSEWEYSSISDHRIIKLLHDLSRYRQREAAGKAKREQLQKELPRGQKPQPRKRTDAQERAAMVQRAKAADSQTKMATIAKLISEG